MYKCMKKKFEFEFILHFNLLLFVLLVKLKNQLLNYFTVILVLFFKGEM